MNRSQRIAPQLGMAHGTAANKLRKNILFYLAQQLDLTWCFKCGTLIESVDDFSIEHKEPWEGRDAELFWDLNNIAFSHLSCNRVHKVTGKENIKKAQEANRKCEGDLKWCWRCKTCLPLDRFTRNASNFDGLEYCCSICRNEWQRKKYRGDFV